MRRVWALGLLLALVWSPTATAVEHTTQETPNEEPPGEQESLEGTPGLAYGWALIVGVVAFAAILGWVSHRYHKRPPLP